MAMAFETLIGALSEALEEEVKIATDGIAEVAVGTRAICLKAIDNGTRLRLFTTLETPLSTPHEKLPTEALTRALQWNLFTERTAGHTIGLFAQTLLLSIDYPLEGMTTEELAERLLLINQIAEESATEILAEAPATPDPTPEMPLEEPGLTFLRA